MTTAVTVAVHFDNASDSLWLWMWLTCVPVTLAKAFSLNTKAAAEVAVVESVRFHVAHLLEVLECVPNLTLAGIQAKSYYHRAARR